MVSEYLATMTKDHFEGCMAAGRLMMVSLIACGVFCDINWSQNRTSKEIPATWWLLTDSFLQCPLLGIYSDSFVHAQPDWPVQRWSIILDRVTTGADLRLALSTSSTVPTYL